VAAGIEVSPGPAHGFTTRWKTFFFAAPMRGDPMLYEKEALA
jgi:hypothetical protein